MGACPCAMAPCTQAHKQPQKRDPQPPVRITVPQTCAQKLCRPHETASHTTLRCAHTPRRYATPLQATQESCQGLGMGGD